MSSGPPTGPPTGPEDPLPWWAQGSEQPAEQPAQPPVAPQGPAPAPPAPQPPADLPPSPYDAVYGSAYAPSPGDGPTDSLGRPVPAGSPGPAWWVLLLAALLIALVAGLLGGFLGAWLTSEDRTSSRSAPISLGTAPSGSLSRSPDSVAGIAQQVLPTVVSVDVRADGSSSTGSGFVLSQDGYILTNNHVIASAAGGGTVRVTFNDGTSAVADIVGRTVTYDLAVLKVHRTGLPVATLGNSDAVVVGDAAIAVGSPLGLSGTVTSGIISAKDRPVTAGEGNSSDVSYISALQTDAAINPGNSGGPLVDAEGKVIGVNSAIATLGATLGGQSGSIGLGFSIPINQARRTAEQLINDGKASYPIIGAVLDPTYTGAGVRIADQGPQGTPAVAAGGPADRAGLQPGDVIVALDGRPVAGPDELIVAIRSHVPGDAITLTFERDGHKQTVQVVLGEATD